MNDFITTSPEDIARLKAAYRIHQQTVTLTDGRTVKRSEEKRVNSCYLCVFACSVGCYCENGEIWIEKQGLSESK